MSDLSNAAKRGGSSMSVFGVVCIILGILCMLAPGWTGMSIAVLVGLLVLLAGILRVTWAFRAASPRRGLWSFAVGALMVIAGLMLVTDPILASGLLTILLAAYFIVDGIVEFAAGSRLQPQAGAGWLMFGGILSIILGALIWAQFPLAGAWAIGILLGIKLLMVGGIMVVAGSALRDAVRE